MKIIALILNILGIPAFAFSCFMVIMSPMLFDAPGSDKSKALWFIAGCSLLLPILLLLGEILGWKNYINGDYPAAIGAFKWALIDFLLIIATFWVKS